jgi:hypothetical protein
MRPLLTACLLALAACAGERPVDPSLPEPVAAERNTDGLLVDVKLDKELYTAKANTIRCITTPCPSNGEPAVANVTITVTNATFVPKIMEFTSGQRFDLQVLDVEGNVLKTWSADKMFMMATEEVRIESGQKESWTTELSLDAGGAELAGDYVVRAKVLGIPEHTDVPVKIVLEGS